VPATHQKTAATPLVAKVESSDLLYELTPAELDDIAMAAE
jgi:hypothetical protein